MAVPVLLLCAMLTVVQTEDLKPLVTTMGGQLRGDRRNLNGIDYDVFKGVPYAEPPVGQLRFSAPVPKTPWNGVRNATRFSPSCPQDISGVSKFYPEYMVQIPEEAQMISEDCLTLNIYVPTDVGNGTEDPLAVMLFVHGGSSLTGQGSGYDGSGLAVRGGLVVVTINYRLNVFGYLGTGDDVAPGNFGLLDQQLALKWVHDNIAAFGGDPGRITLFGQSAGGLDVSLHLFANASRPLFKRIASHSGPTYSAFLPPRNYSTQLFFEIGQALGCNSPDTSELINCLREKPMEEVLSAAKRLTSDVNPLPVFFSPVLDDVFVSPTVGHQDLTHDLMILHTSGDGSVLLEIAALDLFPGAFNASRGATEEQFAGVLSLIGLGNLTRIAATREYTDPAAPDQDFNRIEAIVALFLDVQWIVPLSKIIENQPKLSSLRWSVFDHRSSVDRRYPRLTLAPHGEELPYVFGLPFSMTSSYTDEERQLSDRVIRYWSNFAKTGDPNVNPDLNTTGQVGNLTYWPQYGDTETYLLIQLNDSTVGQGYRKDKVKFWTDYLPKLSDAATEYCQANPMPGAPSTASPDCGELYFGEGLGLKLTRQQAETLIEVFMFLVIALVAFLILIFGAVMGYKYRYKESRKASLKEKGGARDTNGEINKLAAFEVNEGFTESEDTKM